MQFKSVRLTCLVSVCIAALAALSLSGCASIVSGSLQTIRVSSEPSEARVRIYDTAGTVVFDSHTPATVSLNKGRGYFQGASYRVAIEKDGYKPQEVMIRSDLNVGWYVVGNFFIGYLIGWLVIDPISGAMWTLTPEAVNANLSSAGVSAAQQAGDIRVVLLEDVPEGLRSAMQPVADPQS